MDSFGKKVQCGSVSGFFLPYDFLNRIFFSQTYVIVRISVVHKLHKMCAYQLLTSSVSLLVNGRLLVGKFLGESRARCVASPPVVQGSCVYLKKKDSQIQLKK